MKTKRYIPFIIVAASVVTMAINHPQESIKSEDYSIVEVSDSIPEDTVRMSPQRTQQSDGEGTPGTLYAVVDCYIEGFYIIQYLKSEVFGANCDGQVIDYSKKYFYFTESVNGVKMMVDSIQIFHSLSNEHYKNIEIYQFPPFDSIDNKCCYNSNSILSDGPFFILHGDSLHVYSIHRIRGHAIRLTIDNDYLNTSRRMRLAVEYNIDNVEDRIPSFYLYLMCDFEDKYSNELSSFFKEIQEKND